MPSTVGSNLTVDSSSNVNFNSRRTRLRSARAISDNLATGVTARRSEKSLHGRKDAGGCIIPTDVQRSLMGCKVLLSDILSPGSQIQHLTKEGNEASQIHNVLGNEKQSSSGQNNLTSPEPNSYVTRRTNSRRTKSIRIEHTPSIIHLDESSISTKSVVEIADATQPSFSSNDVIVQLSKDVAIEVPSRVTRRMSIKAAENPISQNTINSRTAAKRKSENATPAQDMGISQTKRRASTTCAVRELSVEATSLKSSTAEQKDIQPATDKESINHTSIVHLDQSSIGTKSITEMPGLSQTLSRNDVMAQVPKDIAISNTRRVTRRSSMKATDCNSNTITNTSSRQTLERKTGTSEEPFNMQPSVLQLSATAAATGPTVDKQNINTEISSTNGSLDKLDNNAFKMLIVSVKRIALALSDAELKRLKYEDSANENNRASLRSSSKIRLRPTSGIKTERDTLTMARSTMRKPKIMVTSPIIEVPESPPVPERTPLGHSYLTVTHTATAQLDRFKKSHPTEHPQLPPLIEHEDEENDDVYEFLSCSQNSGVTKSVNPTQKPKHKKVQKASAPSVKNKRKASGQAKRQANPPKQANPFGCNKNLLLRVIKKLGGGRVQQPTTVDYKINLEIPKTPSVASTPVAELHQLNNNELTNDDTSVSVEVPRACHPAVGRLKTGQSSFPLTSTPANRLGRMDALNITSTPQNAASPWRVQDANVVPRMSFTHLTKEMLPSYESFATENNIPSAFVTERRKSPYETCGSIATVPENAPEPTMPEQSCEASPVSDKDLREIEQMYLQLKATSEMSQKLINAMRSSKKNPTTPQQNHTMRLACLKLKKWYERSMNAFNRSMRIVSNIQSTTERSANRPMACPSPLTLEQQRTLNNFNSSTDHFRSMIDQLHSAINDSDVENRPPLAGSFETADTGKGPTAMLNEVTKPKTPKDVVILPDRGAHVKRNPLMPLNVVPLPQHDSPLMSPLAKTPTTGYPNNIRRELQYDKENGAAKVTDKQQQQNVDDIIPAAVPELHEPAASSVVEIDDESTHNGDANVHSSSNKECSTEETQNARNYFGFDGDDSSVEERSAAQITLPMPLNISHETLQRRLQDMKQLLPKRPIFRNQAKKPQNRTSGPTRFPATKLRVFGSPTKRPQTLREFVASTPRPAGSGCSKEQGTAVPSTTLTTCDIEAPDVSAIEPITAAATVEQSENDAPHNNEPEVALFDTPDRPVWLNNSALQRTYARIPRRKKKNIYLANLGLDDDSEDDENVLPTSEQELSSDSETDVAKRKKNTNKRKARRKQPVRVEQTKDFKQFVENFNSMCEEVERYELVIE